MSAQKGSHWPVRLRTFCEEEMSLLGFCSLCQDSCNIRPPGPMHELSRAVGSSLCYRRSAAGAAEKGGSSRLSTRLCSDPLLQGVLQYFAAHALLQVLFLIFAAARANPAAQKGSQRLMCLSIPVFSSAACCFCCKRCMVTCWPCPPLHPRQVLAVDSGL